MRRPREEDDDDGGVDEHAKDKDGRAPHVPDDEAEAEGAERVGGAVGHQDEPHVLHAVRAGDVALEGIGLLICQNGPTWRISLHGQQYQC